MIVSEIDGVPVRGGYRFVCKRCRMDRVASHSQETHYCGVDNSARVAAVPALPPAPTHGPGTELKKLLSKVGITTKPGCACNRRARVMDEKGCDWCAENLSTITAWLKEEHTRQKIMIPFSETAVSLLVRYAIRRARAIAK